MTNRKGGNIRPVVTKVSRFLPSYFYHRYAQRCWDAAAAALALVLAYMLRFDFHLPATQRKGLLMWLLLLAVVRPLVMSGTRGYNVSWRFFDLRDAIRLASRALPVTAGLLLVRALIHGVTVIPYSVLILEFVLFLTIATCLRAVRRYMHESIKWDSARSRTLIVGNQATLPGATRHLQTHGEVQPVGIISEDADLLGLFIGGVPVLGLPRSLANLLATHQIQTIVLAGADLDCAPQIIQGAAGFDVRVCILPSFRDLMQRKVRVSRLIGIEQITRQPHPKDVATLPPVVECFRSRTVLVTGAGGSIGSEVARQVSALAIERLIVLDQDENAIFELLNELGHKDFEIVPIVGNIQSREVVRHTFRTYRPDIVLHAAAYKHVPVMEVNCSAAVLNNVGGTRELADAAIEFGCQRMVMISSDKAVRPSSVMGATKRVAEMLIQQRAAGASWQSHKTRFACVRFGNVLGSRGSVVPIFLRQIAAGGPVTITHEEMTRYFMTIPQAVHLVLQAASLASAGEVYLLDMGDPVKIMDFAKEIIEMAGLTPGKDIEIKVIGTRPGEKLQEQLWEEDARVNATAFQQVFRVEATLIPATFASMVADLEGAGHARNSDLIHALLHRLPIAYRSQPEHELETALAS